MLYKYEASFNGSSSLLVEGNSLKIISLGDDDPQLFLFAKQRISPSDPHAGQIANTHQITEI
jgi:hypothetical protein